MKVLCIIALCVAVVYGQTTIPGAASTAASTIQNAFNTATGALAPNLSGLSSLSAPTVGGGFQQFAQNAATQLASNQAFNLPFAGATPGVSLLGSQSAAPLLGGNVSPLLGGTVSPLLGRTAAPLLGGPAVSQLSVAGVAPVGGVQVQTTGFAGGSALAGQVPRGVINLGGQQYDLGIVSGSGLTGGVQSSPMYANSAMYSTSMPANYAASMPTAYAARMPTTYAARMPTTYSASMPTTYSASMPTSAYYASSMSPANMYSMSHTPGYMASSPMQFSASVPSYAVSQQSSVPSTLGMRCVPVASGNWA